MADWKIHHIGYLVRNMEKAVDEFLELGFIVSQDMVYDKYRDIEIVFMEKDGYRIELVKPKTKDSVVYDLQKKIGNAPYHICYEVDDLEKAVSELEGRRYVIYQEAHQATALQGRQVVFLMHGQIGLVELVEKDL